MKKTINKAAAFLLIAALMYGLLPPDIVLANTQIPVTILTISDLSDSGSKEYKFNLRWDQPPYSNNGVGNPVNPENDKSAERYEIYYRNASKGQSYPAQSVVQPPVANNGTGQQNYILSPVFEKGSLYVLKVEAVHDHIVHSTNANGQPVTNTVKAPADTSYKTTEVIYMTDLEVSAAGSGNQMTVTWSDPKFDGKDIFTGYRIYYVPGGSLNATVPTNPHIDVSVSDANLQKLSGNLLQYTFQDDNLKPGVKYALKVEPLYNGVEVRKLSSINYNGTDYGIYYTDMTKREYRTNDASVNLSLNAVSEDDTHVRVYWDSFATIQEVTRVELYSSSNEDFTSVTELKGTLLGDSAKTTNYYIVDKPKYKTFYKLYMYTEGSDVPVESELAWFDPTYNEFEPYSPAIKTVEPSTTAPLKMSVTWEAFIRKPYNDDETQNINNDYGKMYLDRDVYYDIWVTDDANNFDRMNADQVVSTLDAVSLQASVIDPPNTPTFSTSVNEYYTAEKDPASGAITGYTKKSLEDNKTYYIKIVARRKTEAAQTSKPAYGSCFIPPLGDIPTDPVTISRPPLRIKKDASGGDVITQSSITVQWDIRWVEMYNDTDKSWYSMVSVNTSGGLAFGKDIKDTDKILELNKAAFINGDAVSGYTYNSTAVLTALQGLGANITASTLPSLRLTELKNVNYEIHVAEYDLMAASPYTGYESYLAMLMSDGNESLWKTISPTGDLEHPEYTVTNSDNPSGSLKQNTAYIIFFRPYVESDRKRVSYYPSFAVGTTRDVQGQVDIKPTVPILQAVSETDMTLTVRWSYNPNLTYELAFSESLANYKDNGTVIPWSAMSSSVERKTENGTEYMYYTITGLFPDTIYHIWIRSIAQNSSGPESSEWSNPITMQTKDILAPSPPRGLGPASKDDVTLYNKTNGVNYMPTDYNYIIAEWMRDMSDQGTSTQGTAGASGTAATAEVLSHPDITAVYMVKFNELTANKAYYIRAKTVLTITKSGEEVQRQYNYVVQMSQNADFTDAVEISVPQMEDISSLDPVFTKRKESDWCDTVILYTDPSSLEYDGDKNPDQYPLPVQDYEITYDSATDTLTFRFRTDKNDASGAKDNSVDQRFISKLVADRVFDYEVNLSMYNGKNVKNRTIELPYSIFTAFEERKINLILKADNLTITFTPGSLSTAEVKALPDFGRGADIRITLNEYAAGIPSLKYNESYASKPQKLSVQAVTPTRSVSLANLSKGVTLDMKLSNRAVILDKNVGAYVSDKNTAGWQRERSEYNNVTGNVSVSTSKLGSYSVIAINAAQAIAADDTADAMYNVASRLNISDMYTYNPGNIITATQFNNLTAAVAKNSLDVKLNGTLSSSDRQSLSRSNLLVSGGNLSREAGISALVKLYELKTGSSVKNYSSLEETSYKDIAEAAAQYHTAMLKAGELGFYRNTASNPKGEMTLGDVIYILDLIIQDAGL